MVYAPPILGSYVLKIQTVCLCDRQTFYHNVQNQHIIYGWIQNLSGHVTVINSNSKSEARAEQVNHALNIDLGITTSICLCVMATKISEYLLLFKFIIYNYIIITFEIKSIHVYKYGYTWQTPIMFIKY